MIKKDIDRPQKVRTTLQELEILENLKDSVEWAILKRFANRYIDNLRKISFKLLQSDANFIVKHTELTGQALGIRVLMRMVEEAGTRKEREEKRTQKLKKTKV